MTKKKNTNLNKTKKEYCNTSCLLCGSVIGGEIVEIPNIPEAHAISLITGQLCNKCNNKLKNKVVCIAGTLSDNGRLIKASNKCMIVEEKEYIKQMGKPEHKVIVFPNETWDHLFTTFKTLN